MQAQLAPFEAGTMMSYPLPASPEDLAVESANHLWFTLPTANAIGSVEVSSLDDNVQYRYASYAVPTGSSSPQQLVISNGVVWFTEQGANKIGKFDIGSRTFAEYDVPTLDSGPTGIDVAPDGKIWSRA